MHRRALLLSAAFLPVGIAAAPLPFAQFKTQEIDKTLKVGYGVRIADLNADKRPDILVADAARVVWFDNAGGWRRRTIIENDKVGVKTDNVCLDVADIDGDGDLDIALGAGWQPANTATGGSLQWLRQGKTIDAWTVHPIATEPIPTLHRIYLVDVNGDGRRELLVAPLRGARSTARENFMDQPVQLLAFDVPKEPAGKWDKPRAIDESTHSTHNVRFVKFHPLPAIFTASAEGVGALNPRRDGGWSWTHVGAGNQENPKGNLGAGEVAQGMARGKPAFIASVEPMHGHEVVVYAGDPSNGKLLDRTVIDDQLAGGHALWCADLDGDRVDEIVAGFREPTAKGIGPGINVYKAASADAPTVWQKHVLDDKGIACEDLACADLNADGRIDIIGVGRTTGNVRIYWNQGVN